MYFTTKARVFNFSENYVNIFAREILRIARFRQKASTRPGKINFARSSNGRTHGFGPWYRGSSPCRAAIVDFESRFLPYSLYLLAF